MNAFQGILADHIKLDFDETAMMNRLIAQVKEEVARTKRTKIAQALLKNLFGDGGLFTSLSITEQVTLLEAVLSFFEQYAQNEIEHSRKGNYDGIDWGDANVRERCDHLVQAAKHGVFVPDWKNRFAKIEEATQHYCSRYSGRAIGFQLEYICESATTVEILSGEKPEGLKDRGLQLFPTAMGKGEKMYVNGQFVSVMVGGQFSDQAYNAGVVAWLKVSTIDHCRIKGDQQSYEVYAWKSGLKEPARIFEDHAYDSERYLSVATPIVLVDGRVQVTVQVNGTSTVNEFSVPTNN